MFQLALIDFRKFVAGKLRLLEEKRARGNVAKVQEFVSLSDDEIIRKWLWMVAIVGGPSCFLVLPFTISILQPFLWVPLTAILWVTAKCLMVMTFLIFLLAAYFTHVSST